MELEQDQEVWIKVKVVSATPHRVKVGVGEIYAVVFEEHYNRSSPQIVFVGEHDIVTGPIYKDYSDGEEPIPAWGEALWKELRATQDLRDELETRVDKLDITAETLGAGLAERVSDLEERLDNAEREAGMLEDWRVKYTELRDFRKRLNQVECDIETHNEVITRMQKGVGYPESFVEEWDNPYDDVAWNRGGYQEVPWIDEIKRKMAPVGKRMEVLLFPTSRVESHSVTYEAPVVDNVCRVCDQPIGKGKRYCNDCSPLRTGEEIINTMGDQ